METTIGELIIHERRVHLGRILAAILAILAVALCACESETQPKPDQQVTSSDVGTQVPDAGVADAADAAVDGFSDAGMSGDGLTGACTGACAKQTLEASFGGVKEPIERAIYGLDRDKAGQPGTYIEAIHGGFAGCPEQTSPTPDRTLIISGLPLPQSGPPITKADGLVVSLLDFTGTLLKGAPLAKATAASVTFVAADVCPTCVGKPAPAHPGGFVALDISATFADGKVEGHLHATHCDSLDL